MSGTAPFAPASLAGGMVRISNGQHLLRLHAKKLVSSRLTLYLCVHVWASFARDFYRVFLQAVGDKIVEVDGLSVSDKSLLTYIVGTDTPDTFVDITVTSLPAPVVRAHVKALGLQSSYVQKCTCGAGIFVQIHM